MWQVAAKNIILRGLWLKASAQVEARATEKQKRQLMAAVVGISLGAKIRRLVVLFKGQIGLCWDRAWLGRIELRPYRWGIRN
jgi:hypothetical protein